MKLSDNPKAEILERIREVLDTHTTTDILAMLDVSMIEALRQYYALRADAALGDNGVVIEYHNTCDIMCDEENYELKKALKKYFDKKRRVLDGLLEMIEHLNTKLIKQTCSFVGYEDEEESVEIDNTIDRIKLNKGTLKLNMDTLKHLKVDDNACIASGKGPEGTPNLDSDGDIVSWNGPEDEEVSCPPTDLSNLDKNKRRASEKGPDDKSEDGHYYKSN